MKFAKLFDVEDGQVLFVKRYDDEEDVFTMTVTTEIDGITVSQQITYDVEEDSLKDFNKMNMEDAVKVYEHYCKFFEVTEEDEECLTLN